MTPTWGDTVRVKADAPTSMRPGALAAVVGMRGIESSAHALELDAAIGSKVYTIEFRDGAALEVSEAWLEGPLDPTTS